MTEKKKNSLKLIFVAFQNISKNSALNKTKDFCIEIAVIRKNSSQKRSFVVWD